MKSSNRSGALMDMAGKIGVGTRMGILFAQLLTQNMRKNTLHPASSFCIAPHCERHLPLKTAFEKNMAKGSGVKIEMAYV